RKIVVIEKGKSVATTHAAAERAGPSQTWRCRSAIRKQIGRCSSTSDIVISVNDVKRDATNVWRPPFVRRNIRVPVSHPHIPVVAVGASNVDVVPGVESEVRRWQGRLPG